ncbi:DedA family protein [Mycetocola tolaasinivorans]|uniref:DedA family protein n=1 Tax=Mycetocola tolaasinivorans TaxID=76635 RepID=A0A3L7AD18_9MICO|nr:DedA family protein [Mycetocola tolaasinivorans]RLP77874.1 DedA family protein [Mycetocola tolaasinivorans]
MFDALNDAIMTAVGSPWITLIIPVVVFIDAFFPPIPSETVVVAAAALGFSMGTPNAWVLILLAALGAIAGDNLTYWIGRRVDLTRFRWMRAERSVTALEWARRGLEKRTGVLILTGRYIPVGRVAVNLTAGATGLPRRRFVPLSILAGVTWALYTVGIGVWAGAWFRETPLLGAVIAVVVAIVVGFVIDRISTARAAARERAIGTTGTTGTARTPHATARHDAARIPPVRATMREDHARTPFN